MTPEQQRLEDLDEATFRLKKVTEALGPALVEVTRLLAEFRELATEVSRLQVPK
jgi:hypothetical protein